MRFESNHNFSIRGALRVIISIALIMQSSGCTYVSPRRNSLDNSAEAEIVALERDPTLACMRALEDLPGCPNNMRCPDATYTAARCYLEGLGSVSMDRRKGAELMTYAAGCGILPAKETLQRLGIQEPPPIVSLGYHIFPPTSKEQQMCGVQDSATAFTLLGSIAVAPVLLAAGVVVAAGVIVVAPPYCAGRWLFTSGSCLDDLRSKSTDERQKS